MSQVKHESFGDGYFVQLDQPDEVPDQQEAQQQREQPQFGLHQNPCDWDWPVEVDTGSTRNYDDQLKEHKLMIANLEVKNQTLQARVENLELNTDRALKESSEQKENYQALEAKIDDLTKLLSAQNEQHQKKVEQLEFKNRKLEEKLSTVELQTTENGSNLISLEQKLKEAEQKAQMEKNEFEEIIQANQLEMEKFRKEMDEISKLAGSNKSVLDYCWSDGIQSNWILANWKGNCWDASKTKVKISETGHNATAHKYHWVFATEGYAISGEHCRKEHFKFPGTIIYYFEVNCWRVATSSVGFTDRKNPSGPVGGSPNCYGIRMSGTDYSLSGKQHKFEHPFGPIDNQNIGCGILLNSNNELAVFFTVDGALLVKPTPINPTVDRLYPTALLCAKTTVVANFGNDLLVKPFKFDIDNCPGLVFE